MDYAKLPYPPPLNDDLALTPMTPSSRVGVLNI